MEGTRLGKGGIMVSLRKQRTWTEKQVTEKDYDKNRDENQ